MINLIHFIYLEVNSLSTLLHLVAIHTLGVLFGANLGIWMDSSSLGTIIKDGMHGYFIIGEVDTLL